MFLSASTPPSVLTGFKLASQKTIQWDIEMFQDIFKNPALIDLQKIKVEVDGTYDVPSTRWKVFLNWKSGQGVTVSFSADGAWRNHTGDSGVIPIYYMARGCIINERGYDHYCTSKSQMMNSLCQGTFGNKAMQVKNAPTVEVMCLGNDISKIPLRSSGNLRLKLTIELYRTQPEDAFTGKWMKQSYNNLREHMLHLLTSGESSDVKIISSDGRQFCAHRNIMCARNDVFKAMFRNNMREASTGIVKLTDLSSGAVNFMLRFIYCSDILPFTVNGEKKDGTATDSYGSLATIEEVVLIATRYGFKDLMEYIEEKLMSFCNKQNARCLIKLCKTYSLEAGSKVESFIKNNPDVMREVFDFDKLVKLL